MLTANRLHVWLESDMLSCSVWGSFSFHFITSCKDNPLGKYAVQHLNIVAGMSWCQNRGDESFLSYKYLFIGHCVCKMEFTYAPSLAMSIKFYSPTRSSTYFIVGYKCVNVINFSVNFVGNDMLISLKNCIFDHTQNIFFCSFINVSLS